jgi:tRNA(Ile)-lysidine synthase
MAGEGRLTADEFADRVASRLPSVPIVVALSGGADSAALAWAVVSADVRARAISIDHGLPGSAALMESARAVASRLGLEHDVVPGPARSESETDLRVARLAALESAAEPDEVIVTAHTMDDQAETVLGNVLRGAGTAGLAGIPGRRDRWMRPLLDVRRSETRAIAAEIGLPYSDDPQNEDLSIRRNRLRLEALPSLAEAFNPALVEALARLGWAAGSDDAVLERRARRVPVREVSDGVLVPAASLQVLPAAVSARIAARALRTAGAPVGWDAITAVLDAAFGDRTTTGGAVDVLREGPWVVLVTATSPAPDPIYLDPVRGAVWGEWRFERVPGASIGRCATALPGTGDLVIRAPRQGDRIGFDGGSKPVSDALAEASVPARMRTRWPVVESDGRIVWIAGVRAAPAGEGPQVIVRAVRRRT